MMTAEETDDVLKIVDRLCAKQGWQSYQRRLLAIRERVTADNPAPLPPMPAGSIIDPDDFRPCAECACPKTCSEFDSCGRGK